MLDWSSVDGMIIHFLFAENKSWWAYLAKLIKLVEGKGVSHSAIAIQFPGYLVVYESRLPVSRKIYYADWVKQYGVVRRYSFVVPKLNQKRLVKCLDSLTEKKYSIAQILTIGISLISKKLESLINKVEVNGSSSLVCSEFLARVIKENMVVNFDQSLDNLSLGEIEGFVASLKEQSSGGNSGDIWIS